MGSFRDLRNIVSSPGDAELSLSSAGVMAGAVEEGGKVASDVVGALRQQPVILAMVIFNASFIGAVYFGIHEQRQIQNEQMKSFINLIEKQSSSLAQCVMPGNIPGLLHKPPTHDDDGSTNDIPLPRSRPTNLGENNGTPNRKVISGVD